MSRLRIEMWAPVSIVWVWLEVSNAIAGSFSDPLTFNDRVENLVLRIRALPALVDMRRTQFCMIGRNYAAVRKVRKHAAQNFADLGP